MLPEETIKWLREESYINKTSIGEIVRKALDIAKGKPDISEIKLANKNKIFVGENIPEEDKLQGQGEFHPVPKPLKGKR